MKNSISAIILAAGQSKRMNRPKPFLAFDEKKNFISNLISTYIVAGIKKICVVVSPSIKMECSKIIKEHYTGWPVTIVVNSFPEKGRFYSLQLGLEKTDTEFCFIQNADNPFVTENLLSHMCRRIKQDAYVVPVFKNEKGHPIVICKKIMNHCSKLNGNDFNLREELHKFEEISLEWNQKNILANINTEDEYQKYFSTCEVFMK